jgi:tetratricopeptide (TPR) repeat protein
MAVLAMTVAIAYARIWHAEFINLDDFVYVTGNPWVRRGLSWSGAAWALTSTELANWHPLTWLSHMLDVTIFGTQAGGHHATSVLLHAVNTVLLFAFLRTTTNATGRSAIVAFLFGLHPLHVESVAWVSERKDVLSTTFLFIAMAAYARYTRAPSIARYAAVALAFTAGLMAKPMLVTFPLLLLLLDVWPLGRLAGDDDTSRARTLRALVLEKVPLFILSAIVSGITVAAQSGAGAVGSIEVFPVGARIANAALAYVRYVRRMVWPTDLAVFYPYDRDVSPVAAAAAVLAIVSISVVAARARRRRPELFVGWFWYVGMLVPVIGLVQVGTQALADRYTYVPLVGVFIALVWGLGDVAERRVAPALRIATLAALAALAIACVAATVRQLSYWHDSETLFTHALAVTRDNYLASTHLGLRLSEQGRYAEAIERYRDALRTKPDDAEAHNHLAYALAQTGDRAGALEHYDAALRSAPQYADAHYTRGVLLQRSGDVAAAEDDYRAAIAALPSYVEAHNNLGLMLHEQGDLDDSRAHFATAVRLRPDHLSARINLGVVLRELGDLGGAIAQDREALRIDPRSAGAHFNFANALLDHGELDDAVAHYREALRLDPSFDAARDMLQRALGRPHD